MSKDVRRDMLVRMVQRVLLLLVGALLLGAAGCQTTPELKTNQASIDRAIVEYPPGFELTPYVSNLTGPCAICFDADESLLIAESGIDDHDPRVFGFKKNGAFFEIYPRGKHIPFLTNPFKLYGPIGGIVATGGKVFVTHRDENGRGRITAFSYDDKTPPKTIVADLPTQGDYGITDIAVHPNSGRLYFGVGAATNSGVVGLDNLQAGWVKRHSDFCDVPYTDLKLNGFRFDTNNPFKSIFGGTDLAVTGPFQKFGSSDQSGIPHPNGKPTAAVYSCEQGGGDLKVEAHGIRNPAGLTFNEYGTLYMTNQGMELRGSRPIADDPDTFLKMVGGETWYGWPDFSASLLPITSRDPSFQPPREMVIQSGYPDVRFIIDHAASHLIPPSPGPLLFGTFRPLSGASKFDFVLKGRVFRKYTGDAVVALSGDRAPFATSGRKLSGLSGYRVALVNVDSRRVEDFIRNTRELPASRLEKGSDKPVEALERPIDVKFGPDGALYILDFGQVEMKNGKPAVKTGTGKIFRLVGTEPETTTAPAPAGKS